MEWPTIRGIVLWLVSYWMGLTPIVSQHSMFTWHISNLMLPSYQTVRLRPTISHWNLGFKKHEFIHPYQCSVPDTWEVLDLTVIEVWILLKLKGKIISKRSKASLKGAFFRQILWTECDPEEPKAKISLWGNWFLDCPNLHRSVKQTT